MILTALSSINLSRAGSDFEPWIQKQNWDPAEDDLLEMLVETYAKYNARLDFDEPFQQSKPVIGILTMDATMFDEAAARMTEDEKQALGVDGLDEKDAFDHDHFIWEGSVNIVHYAGSWAVPIRYDLDDEDLDELLASINGVLFTGGAMPLVDHDTGEQSTYYKTAKKIFNYAKRQKDQKNIDWPILGICQGMEVLSYLVNNDAKDTLSNVVIYGQSTPLRWEVDSPRSESRLFAGFGQDLLDAMATQELLLQAHDWVVSRETFDDHLSDFFTLLATDHKGEGADRKEFVMAYEAKNYPIFGTMFHPETANRHVVGLGRDVLAGKVNNEVTDEINFRFSEFFHG